jgi:phosphoribosylanthranilate isomerase
MTALFRGDKLQYMTHLRVKICGVTDEAEAIQASELGADAIGLNFYRGSQRYITLEKAESIMRRLPPLVEPVGILVSLDLRPDLNVITKLRLRTIQLHLADEHSSLVFLASPFGIRLISAFTVGEKDDLVGISDYLEKCHESAKRLPAAILIDARVPGQIGGTGKTVPWELLADFHPEVPLILAGGLTPENVAEAVRIVRPYGVDVASGVEKSPGRKDADKMKRFIENAREAADRLS